MIKIVKYSLVRIIEKYPLFHSLIYNNIDNTLVPYEKKEVSLNNFEWGQKAKRIGFTIYFFTKKKKNCEKWKIFRNIRSYWKQFTKCES